jgi:hypothetical protein
MDSKELRNLSEAYMSVGSGASSNPKVPQQVGAISAVASLHDPERAKAQSKLKKN